MSSYDIYDLTNIIQLSKDKVLNSIWITKPNFLKNHYADWRAASLLSNKRNGVEHNQAKKKEGNKLDYVFIIVEDEKFAPWGGK